MLEKNCNDLNTAVDRLFEQNYMQKKRLDDQDSILNKVKYGVLIIRAKGDEFTVLYKNKELTNQVPISTKNSRYQPADDSTSANETPTDFFVKKVLTVKKLSNKFKTGNTAQEGARVSFSDLVKDKPHFGKGIFEYVDFDSNASGAFLGTPKRTLIGIRFD